MSTTSLQANNKKSRWYLTFLPNGAAEEEENDSDEHEEEDEEEISIHGDVAVYLYQVKNITPHRHNLFCYHIKMLKTVISTKFCKQKYYEYWAGVCLWELCDIVEVQDLVPEQPNGGQDAGLWSRLWEEVQIPRLMGMGELWKSSRLKIMNWFSSRAYVISWCQGSSSMMTHWPSSVRWPCLAMMLPSWATLTMQRWILKIFLASSNYYALL